MPQPGRPRAARHDARRAAAALAEAKQQTGTTVIVVETDKECRVPGYDAWWDVPIAEVSTTAEVQRIRAEYEKARRQERNFF